MHQSLALGIGLVVVYIFFIEFSVAAGQVPDQTCVSRHETGGAALTLIFCQPRAIPDGH